LPADGEKDTRKEQFNRGYSLTKTKFAALQGTNQLMNADGTSGEIAMDIDALRNSIWEYLFEAKTAKSIDELAALAAQDVAAVHAAVNHEWFALNHDQVSIAYVAPHRATIIH
jgi:hypothetical protein